MRVYGPVLSRVGQQGARHGDVLRHAIRDAGLLRVHRGVAEHQGPSERSTRLKAASCRSGCPHGGAQQHVRVAALARRAGDASVVHFVETSLALLRLYSRPSAGHARPRCGRSDVLLVSGREVVGETSSASWGPGSASAHPGLRR